MSRKKQRASVVLVVSMMGIGAGAAAGQNEIQSAAYAEVQQTGTEPEKLGILFPDIQSMQQETEQAEILEVPFPDTQNVQQETEILEQGLAAFLPKTWYAGQQGKEPVIKSQGKYASCWALTAASALEASLLPEQEMIFSADHIMLQNAFTADLEDGGDYLMLMAYLSGWQGPVLEQEDPYGDRYSPDGLQAAVHVQEMQLMRGAALDEIKQMLYQYGAIQTSLYMSRGTTENPSYYKKQTAAYYVPESMEENHDVLILGWDDTFSRFQFAQLPPVDGAFICQNTWGSDFGQNGIFYVSYADANILQNGIVYTKVEADDNYARIYQADDCGWQGKQGYGSETCWLANVYTTVGYAETAQADTEKEQLAAVGFYATADQTEYELYLVRDFESEKDFEKKVFLQSGRLQRVGYYTVDLEQAVELETGETYAVIVKITAPGEQHPAAVEYQADRFTQNVTLENRKSYLSRTGKTWECTQERFQTNVCLKAYSRYVEA